MNGSLSSLDPATARIVVAMSGGVDSSVTAALVREAGFETIGITLQLYDHGQATARKGACCAGQDIHDARRVAETIGIPHYVLDYESRFRDSVIEDFADSYLRGETPIPCVRCNQTVKFRDLLQTARDLGADALCTGHYVQRVDGAAGPELHAGADPGKDQSYFLFATTPDQLAFLHFPLGGMDKAETRAHAERLALPVAAKPDSQDICFVPSGDYAGIIEKLRPEAAAPGEIVHLDGRVLGRHDGIARFTIGQRRGLRIGGADGAETEPLYVVRIEPAARRVTVGPRQALARDLVHLAELNWLGGETPGQGREIEVKIRSSGRRLPARLAVHDGGLATVELGRAEYGVSPGQACVFYDGARVLGGGWITDAELTALAA